MPPCSRELRSARARSRPHCRPSSGAAPCGRHMPGTAPSVAALAGPAPAGHQDGARAPCTRWRRQTVRMLRCGGAVFFGAAVRHVQAVEHGGVARPRPVNRAVRCIALARALRTRRLRRARGSDLGTVNPRAFPAARGAARGGERDGRPAFVRTSAGAPACAAAARFDFGRTPGAAVARAAPVRLATSPAAPPSSGSRGA
jgi:hypothetical protein